MQYHLVGLDISDRSAEILAVARSKGGLRVVATGRIDVPPGVVALGVIADPDALVSVLSKLLDQAFGPKRGRLSAGVSLPETVVYAKTFTFPATLTAELVRKAVAIEAADLFPISLHRAVTGFVVTARTKDSQDVFFAATDRDVARGYADVLRRVGINPLFFESESMAIGRALLDPRIQDPVLVADIGSRVTTLAMHDKGVLRMSGSVMMAGDALSTAIERKLGVPLAQAEELRKKAGFDPSIDDGRLFLIMERPMHDIIDEMRRTMAYHEGRTGRKTRAIVLAGGTTLTPQLAEFVASNIPGVETVVGNPFRGASLDGLPTAAAVAAAPVLWSAAMGLALRATGARGSPGINLMPGVRDGEQGFVTRITNALTDIIAMVTGAKKKTPKKGVPKKAMEAAAPPVVPAVAPGAPGPVHIQIDAAPASVAPTTGTVPSGDSPRAQGKEEKDYGHGIGDMVNNGKKNASDVPAPAQPYAGQSSEPAARRSISSILDPEASVESRESDDGAVPSSGTPGRGRMIALIILVVLCFSAAAGGIFMFVTKNGAPGLPSFMTGLFADKGEEVPAPGAVGSDAELPPSVNTVVVLSTTSIDGEQRPVLLTRVIETDVQGTGTFAATGEAAVAAASGRARGKATIINETAQSYEFVATTRLLSKEGVLFRMTSAASIPANGSVTVDVAADQPGPAGDIGPTTFTIPGLPPATQEVVHAKSDSAMTGGSGTAKAVSEADIAAAKATVIATIKAEADENLKALLVEGEILHEDLVTSTEISIEAPAPGTAASQFTMTLSLRYRAMLVPEKDITPLLEDALAAAIPAGQSSADYALGSPLYAVEAYDTATEKAEVRVEAPIIGR